MPAYDKRVKVVTEGEDEKVLVVNQDIVTTSPVSGDLLVFESGEWTVRHLADADVPAAIARDAEVTAAVAAEATARAAADTTEASARAAADTAIQAKLLERASFGYSGVVAVTTGKARYYVEEAVTITAVRISVDTAPTGATLIVDVNKNGTTIYTTQGNRPTIAISGNTATANSPDVTALAAGDYLTIDIDQVGSTIPGSDLAVQVEMRH